MAKLPILLLIFNRPNTTQRVLSALATYKPQRLYIAADGPRQGEGEEERCVAARLAAQAVDWECSISTLFREENLGLRRAVCEAIDWFFYKEEEGIILEDDCVPSPSFWPYCEELIDRYRDNSKVMAISGGNYQRGRWKPKESYYFSKYPHCWGWATWRRAWRLYDRDFQTLDGFDESGGFAHWSDGCQEFEEHFRNAFRAVHEGRLNSWAYCWTFSCWANDGLTCLPAFNLVKNIGFNEYATHTRYGDSWLQFLEAGKLKFPLIHPAVIERSIRPDRDTAVMVYGINDPEYIRFKMLQSVLNPIRVLKQRLVSQYRSLSR